MSSCRCGMSASRKSGWTYLMAIAALAFRVVAPVGAADVVVSTVHVFHHLLNGEEGADPGAVLAMPDGTLYGTTSAGGKYGAGTVFMIGGDGRLVTLHAFGGADGTFPDPCMVAGADGAIYGTTGTTGFETMTGVKRVFRITRRADFSMAAILYPPTSRQDVWSVTLDGRDRRIYTITNTRDFGFSLVGQASGSSTGSSLQLVDRYVGSAGTVFLNDQGRTAVMAQAVRALSGGGDVAPARQQPRNQASAQCGDTIITADGHFWHPQVNGKGVGRSVSTDLKDSYYLPVNMYIGVPANALGPGTMRQNPEYPEAAGAYGRFARAPHNSIWATSTRVVQGAWRYELIEVTPTGVIARRISLDNVAEGFTPFGGLVNGAGGDLYGLADEGEASGRGVALFRLSAEGSVEVVHRFADEGNSLALGNGLVMADDGNMYVTFSSGGKYGQGVIYRVSVEH